MTTEGDPARLTIIMVIRAHGLRPGGTTTARAWLVGPITMRTVALLLPVALLSPMVPSSVGLVQSRRQAPWWNTVKYENYPGG